MPPEHYEKKAVQSRIKAVAVVEKVRTMERTKKSSYKEVLFRRIHSFTPETPATFKGTCHSVDHQWQDPGVGGIIYSEEGKRVFVAVAEDGGSITSYTVLSPQLEKAIIENPAGVRFKMGKAYLAD